MEVSNAYIAPGLVRRKLFIEEAAAIVLKEMNSTLEEIRMKTRKEEIRSKRQKLQYLLRWYGFKYVAIGNFTFQDHATVINSEKAVENDMFTDRELKNFIRRMQHTKLRKE